MTCSPRCWGASTRPSEPDVVHARAASNRCTTALRDLLGLVRRYWLPVGTSLNRCPRNQSAAKHAKRWPPITRRSSPSSSRTSPLRSTASAMVTSTYSTSTACCFSTPELPESYGSTATWATSRSPHATCSRRRRLIGGNAEPQGAMNAAASFRVSIAHPPSPKQPMSGYLLSRRRRRAKSPRRSRQPPGRVRWLGSRSGAGPRWQPGAGPRCPE